MTVSLQAAISPAPKAAELVRHKKMGVDGEFGFVTITSKPIQLKIVERQP